MSACNAVLLCGAPIHAIYTPRHTRQLHKIPGVRDHNTPTSQHITNNAARSQHLDRVSSHHPSPRFLGSPLCIFHGHGHFSCWLRSRSTQGVLLFGLRLILGPNACADRSGRARSLQQIGLCIRWRRSATALVTPVQLSLRFSFSSFSVSCTAGSPYRECLHREIDGTVWTPTIKNIVMVMLYPPYTPLSLITTSLRATEDQTNVSPGPTISEPFFSLCPSVGRLFAHRWMSFGDNGSGGIMLLMKRAR